MLIVKALPNKGKSPTVLSSTKKGELRIFSRTWFGVSRLSPTEIAGNHVKSGDRSTKPDRLATITSYRLI